MRDNRVRSDLELVRVRQSASGTRYWTVMLLVTVSHFLVIAESAK